MGRRVNESNARKQKVNICGEWIKYVRTGKYDKYHPKISQDTLIARLQTRGLMMKRSLKPAAERLRIWKSFILQKR